MCYFILKGRCVIFSIFFTRCSVSVIHIGSEYSIHTVDTADGTFTEVRVKPNDAFVLFTRYYLIRDNLILIREWRACCSHKEIWKKRIGNRLKMLKKFTKTNDVAGTVPFLSLLDIKPYWVLGIKPLTGLHNFVFKYSTYLVRLSGVNVHENEITQTHTSDLQRTFITGFFLES